MKSKQFWQFKVQKSEEKAGELLIYNEIASSSWWGDEVTPKQFKKDLDALGAIDTLNIYINSPGGDVFAAQSIHNILKRHSASKTVYIDGLAASGAVDIALAGDRIIMPANAMMMVHNAWTFAMGFAADLRKVADELDKIQEARLPMYTAKTGLSEDEIKSLLDAETWMTAAEAKEYGFADEVLEEKKVAAALKGAVFSCNGVEIDTRKFPAFPFAKVDQYVPDPTPPVSREIPVEICQEKKRINERRLKHL